MTFDFAPDWMTSLLQDTPFSPISQVGLPQTGSLPSYPNHAEVAALVSELFTEGTLSPEQLCSLAGLPELQPHLRSALAAMPAPRTR
ncbi:MAG: hypothetical protein Q7R40_16055 [Phaeospirillum sp.]|nr:hypothetical protein [Phaeospirillum sp.]